MNRLDTDSLFNRFKERNESTAAVSLTDFKQITPTLAKVVVTYANLDKLPKADIRAEIAKMFDYKASPIESSFRTIRSVGLPAAVGFVRVNRESKPYEQKEVARMRVLAANMLMDEADDSLWNVRTTSDGERMLCRQVKEDISELLETASVHVHRAPELAHVASYALPGDMVLFIDPKTESVKAGIVVDMDSAHKEQTVDVPEGSERLVVMELPSGLNESDEMRAIDMPIAERVAKEASTGDSQERYQNGLAIQNEGLNSSDEMRTGTLPIAERLEGEREGAGLHEILPEWLVAAATSKEVQQAAADAGPTNANSRQALKQYWAQVWGPISKEYQNVFDKIIETTFA